MTESVKFLGSFGGFLVLVGMAATIDSADEFFLFSFPNSAGAEAPGFVISMWEIGLVLFAFAVLLWGGAKLWD